jgi:acetyl esterase
MKGFIVAAIAFIFYYVWNSKSLSPLPGEHQMDWRSFAVAKLTKMLIPQPFPSLQHWTIISARSSYSVMAWMTEKWVIFQDPSLARINFVETEIPVPLSYTNLEQVHDGSNIKIRIYNFDNVAESLPSNHDVSDIKKLKKVLLWFHSGGWVIGSMKEDHSICLRLAKQTDYVIVNVDYRLAPEFLFPTAMEDSYRALEWTIANIHRYGGNATKIILAGESAGGNMAATVTTKYLSHSLGREISRIAGLMMVYPVTAAHTDINDPNVAMFAETTGILSWKTMESFRAIYFNTTSPDIYVSNQDPRYAPIYTSETVLKHYPPTLVVAAKFDVLTAETLQFANKIAAQGADVLTLIYDSIHGFFGRNLVSTHGSQAFEEAVHQLLLMTGAADLASNNE